MEDIFHLGIKALIKNKEGKILLLKVNPKALKGFSGETYWDIPGGRIQKGNTVEATLIREVEEETGISKINSFKTLQMVLSNIRIPVEKDSVGLILSVYICNIDNTDTIELSDEHIDHNWFSPKEAAKLLEVKYPKEFTEKINGLK